MHRTQRWILPSFLLLVGVCVLAGCIYIPLPRKPMDPKQVDPSTVIGPRGSDKPIVPGQVKKERVIEVLGPPLRESEDGRAIGYVVRRKGGLWIMPFCAYRGQYDLAVRLDFDEQGALTRYQFMEREGQVYLFEGNYVGTTGHEIREFMNAIAPSRDNVWPLGEPGRSR